jgi:5-methylthioadenosine/S-adenosylhomocysteine deaminase
MDTLLLEMRQEVLMQSLAHANPAALGPDTALAMATRNGARACGAEESLGSLEVGKKADLVTVVLDRPHSAPMLDPLHALVHMAHPDDVDTVLVDGRAVVEGGRVRGIDEAALTDEVQKAARRYLERAGHGDLLPAYLP